MRWLAVPAVVAVLAAGLWFWSGVVAPGATSAIVLGVAWFFAVSFALTQVSRRRPALKTPARAAYLACAVAAGVAFYATSIRETVVDEPVSEGVPASQVTPAPGEPELDPLAPQPE